MGQRNSEQIHTIDHILRTAGSSDLVGMIVRLAGMNLRPVGTFPPAVDLDCCSGSFVVSAARGLPLARQDRSPRSLSSTCFLTFVVAVVVAVRSFVRKVWGTISNLSRGRCRSDCGCGSFLIRYGCPISDGGEWMSVNV